MAHPTLAKAIGGIGLSQMASHLGLTYQAIRKWEAAGRLPRTEWTGETDYATRIAGMQGCPVTREELMQVYREPARAA